MSLYRFKIKILRVAEHHEVRDKEVEGHARKAQEDVFKPCQGERAIRHKPSAIVDPGANTCSPEFRDLKCTTIHVMCSRTRRSFINERHEGDLGGLQCGVTIDPDLEILSRPILRPKGLDTSQGQKNRPRDEGSLVHATPSWISSNTTYQAVPAATSWNEE